MADSIEEISLSEFVVQSTTTNNDEYNVQVVDRPDDCRGSLCGLKCEICAHQLRCTCPFYAFGRDTCKHVHLIARFLSETGRPLLDEAVEDAVQQRANELYSHIADGLSLENQPFSPLEQQLKAKKQPLLQLVGQVRSLVEKITSPAVDTSCASASLCAALHDLKAISGPDLAVKAINVLALICACPC